MTPKQGKLIKLIIENSNDKGLTKTLGELLLEAGYTKETSKQAIRILESETIQNEIQPIVKVMIEKREKALHRITDEKLDNERARDLASITDILTKNIQLLSGGETERQKLVIEMEKEVLDKYDNRHPENSNTGQTPI